MRTIVNTWEHDSCSLPAGRKMSVISELKKKREHRGLSSRKLVTFHVCVNLVVSWSEALQVLNLVWTELIV